jgi:predicted RNase H-like HicB family nuclease
MFHMELNARVHAEGGSYWAEVAELPGCFASGKTLDELREALDESVRLYLTDRDRPSSTSPLRVDALKLSV